MKIAIGFVLSFLIGAGCRYFDIPAASPPVIPGALIVLAISRAMAENTLDPAYASLDTVDFSRDVLANLPHRLLVLRDRTSGWADLGSPARVHDTLSRNGIQPVWAGGGNCAFDH